MISESKCSKAAETRDDIKTLQEWRQQKKLSVATISKILGIQEKNYLMKEENPLRMTLGEFLRVCYLLKIKTGDVNIFPNGSIVKMKRRQRDG